MFQNRVDIVMCNAERHAHCFVYNKSEYRSMDVKC